MTNTGGSENRPPFQMSDLGATLPTVPGLSAVDRAGLVNVLKDKLQFLAGQSSGYLESLSPKVKARVAVLQSLQTEHDVLEAKFHEERAALEEKYQKLYEPLYTKRADIVNGVVDVEHKAPEAAAPAAAAAAAPAAPAAPGAPAEAAKEEEKGVPEFWLTAMKTNEIMATQISERDEYALKFLKDIKCSNLDDNKGFKLDFYFDRNPYFKNTVLTKTYHMIDDDEPILERADGTVIDWNQGKNLTTKILKKKPKKGAKTTKPVTKTEQCESFFNFFNPPQVPEDDEIDRDTAEQLQDLMEQDYDVGSTIRDKIIPHAVSWFTGEALQAEDFDVEDDTTDDEDYDDDDEYHDEDDEDDDEDEDEDEEEEVHVRKRGGPPSKAATKNSAAAVEEGSERPPECNQQ